jgi:hypothetical protein
MFFQSSEGDVSGQAKSGILQELESQRTTQYYQGLSIGQDFVGSLMQGAAGLKRYAQDLKTAFTKGFAERAIGLDAEATKIRTLVGLNREANNQYDVSIAKAASMFQEYGYDLQAINESYTKVFGNLQAAVAVTEETLLNLRTTSQVTGQDMGALVNTFRGVGVGISDIGDRMLEVVNVARDAGVAVKAVSDGVTANMNKMNLYNFEGGTKGLAKMSTQAAKLGIDMKDIFTIVEKVFNPEGAIELAASMQRLGVQTGALLDPLRLMDLSQNDPTELQNQVVEMSKQFVRFNKELNQFEIMPGEKRRMNEIGKELGMNNGELQKMAINAANLEYKMKQIKLPSGLASKDDKELIATLATINKEGIAEVKVEKLDSQGKGIGEYIMKAVDQLNPEDIKNLKNQQEMQGKTMEEIALDQLDQTKILNNKISQFFTAAAYGVSGSKVSRDTFDFATMEGRNLIGKGEKMLKGTEFFGGKSPFESQTWMDKSNKLYDDNRDKALNFIEEAYKTSSSYVTDLLKKIEIPGLSSLGSLGDIDFGSITSSLSNLYDKANDALSFFGVGGSETDPFSDFTERTEVLNTNITNTVTQLSTMTMPKIEFEPLEINENVNVTIKVDLDPNIRDQALTSLATKAINDYFYDGPNSITNKTNLKNALNDIRPGVLVATKNTDNLVSIPGKNS